MRWQFGEFGLEHLHQVHDAPRDPGHGQVRLRMSSISLNYRDLLMIRGAYDPRVRRPLVPCSDGVGVVEAVGPGVGIALGERRLPLFTSSWRAGPPRAEHLTTTLGGPLDGTLRSTMVIDADATVPVSPFFDDDEAAALPCAAVTAWNALDAAGVTAGSTVLTLGTGGVSLFALQLARARGARVAITSSSDTKLERAAALGAELCVNHVRDPDWGRAVQRWCGGVDAVIEVGGVGTLAQSLRAVRVGGTIALIGVLAGGSGEVPLVGALMRSVRIQGVFVGSADHLRATQAALVASAQRPVIDQVFAFERAPDAFAYLASGAHFGKVVIRVPPAVPASGIVPA
jgi:NADPH:quinone reductase-like Zn-dependent oxidoreductase